MDTRSFRLADLIFTAVLPMLLAGCAAIVKGTRTGVELDVPPETQIKNYSGYSHELSYSRRNGARLLKLRSGKNYLLEYEYGGNRDSIFLWPKVNAWYVAADALLLPFYVSLPIDYGTGAMYEFDRDHVAFPVPPDLPVDAGSAIPVLSIHRVEPSFGSDDYVQYGWTPPLRIVVAAHMGMKFPFNQVPLLGNDVGITAGYRILEPLVLMGYFGTSYLMDYAPEESDLYMEAFTRTMAVEGRYHLTSSLYATAGAGHLFVEADTVWTREFTPRTALPGFSQSMLTASAGVGLAFQGYFMEYRHNFGFEKLRVTDILTSSVINPEFRFGFNFEF